MTHFKPEYPKGATPLDPDELAGLIPDYITTHGELNGLEQKNILEGLSWAKKQKGNLLDPSFVFELHKRMFKDVWRWAGKQRTSDKSIGVHWAEILNKLGNLLANIDYRLSNEPSDHVDQIAIEFHHKLVEIHLFSNGNGRHARLITDLLLVRHGKEPFSWGAHTSKEELHVEGYLRDQYISALKEADRKNYGPLLKFARS